MLRKRAKAVSVAGSLLGSAWFGGKFPESLALFIGLPGPVSQDQGKMTVMVPLSSLLGFPPESDLLPFHLPAARPAQLQEGMDVDLG